MEKKRYFEIADTNIRTVLPTRMTTQSAGYDFFLPKEVHINPWETAIVDTNIKVHMVGYEALFLHIRSSLGKRGIVLANVTGIVDADYPDTIKLLLENCTEDKVILERGERVVQGVFMPYFTVSDENEPLTERTGGFGSTNE